MPQTGTSTDPSGASYLDAQAAAQVKAALINPAIASRLAETFKVLGDPSRVRIVHALSLEELCTHDLASILGMSESAVSHQLGLLRLLRIVRFRREGRIVYYSLDDEHIRQLFEDSLRHVTEQR
ncbi:MAG: helix-turn-helix transcriptional regulator [Dehalococcoidia bacterium]|nr:MAG: helix-turn-helix transcriptional regulator [Dehalococcoidia bacterium]